MDDPPNDTSTLTPSSLPSIHAALAATLDPRIPNQVRRDAYTFLEHLKSQPDAPHHGFVLAADGTQDDAVRYYGLQLLEYPLRYRWNDYGPAQTEQLRSWVQSLAGDLPGGDAVYIRNKIAQLWVELAKRCWGGEWMDMDALLLVIWEDGGGEGGVEEGGVGKAFVLYVLEMLGEDIVSSEDAVAGLRLETLGAALNEVVITRGLYEEHVKTKGARGQEVRCEGPGWLARICGFLADCLKQLQLRGAQDVKTAREMAQCAAQALRALRPMLAWISLRAALEADCIGCLFLPFHINNAALQTAATETLYALLARHPNGAPHRDEPWCAVQLQALRSDRIALMQRAYEQAAHSTREEEEDENEKAYTLQKKISEILSLLADAVASYPALLHDPSVDIAAFRALLLRVLRSTRLAVSLPVLHSWTKLLPVRDPAVVEGLVLLALGELIGICGRRLLRYESLPARPQTRLRNGLNQDHEHADADDDHRRVGNEEEEEDADIHRHLTTDFDTLPDRHAFLGNYRRYCTSILQAIARAHPTEALQHVLDQMHTLLMHGPYTGGRGFKPENYTRNSLPALRFDAQSNVVGAVLRGFVGWVGEGRGQQDRDRLDDGGHPSAERAREKEGVEQMLREWCRGVMGMHVDDPEVAGQVVHLVVVVLHTIQPDSDADRQVSVDGDEARDAGDNGEHRAFILEIIHHLLTMRLYDAPAHQAFSDAVKQFEALRVAELQKLALRFAAPLWAVYAELEARVAVLVAVHEQDGRLVWGYRAFLFIIVQRAPGIPREERVARLRGMLRPVLEAWMDPRLGEMGASLQGFCEGLGMGGLPEFYAAYGFDRVPDWAAQELDEAGQARQRDVRERSDAVPLRMTKSMLAATTEKLAPASEEFDTACALWGDALPVILPHLLQLLRHAQAFHNLTNWSHLPPNLQAVMKRTLQDRFW
ncbi:karyopherin, partial [Teratosphaeriaceae sp. CCFEE 6253]